MSCGGETVGPQVEQADPIRGIGVRDADHSTLERIEYLSSSSAATSASKSRSPTQERGLIRSVAFCGNV